MTAPRPHAVQARLDPIARRIQTEFAEMPGMRLTFEQIRRLWQLPPADCALVLDGLVDESLLVQDAHGRFCLDDPRRRSALASRRGGLERSA